MGACASRFTMVKNASNAPPPEVESKEVNLGEELVVKKDDVPAEEDDRRQSLGHLLKEGEEKKGSAECNGKASEDVKQDDATEVKPEAVAVADALVEDQTEKAAVADGLKSEEVLACQSVAIGAEKVEEKLAEIVKIETKEEIETLKIEKPEQNKPVEIPETEEQPEKEEEKSADATECEAVQTEKTGEQKPASDVEKKEIDEKSTENIEIVTLEKKAEELVECEPAAEEKLLETPDKKPESLQEAEKTEQKEAADAEKNETEEKPVENTKAETSAQIEDKHVVEHQKTENCSDNKPPETISEEQKPASDAEKPKVEKEKANACN